jgi:hypothetical protein
MQARVRGQEKQSAIQSECTAEKSGEERVGPGESWGLSWGSKALSD